MPLAGTLPITVIIPTKNEDKNIRDCLASVAWADQVLVVAGRRHYNQERPHTALGNLTPQELANQAQQARKVA